MGSAVPEREGGIARELGSVRIAERIAVGGMAEVFRGTRGAQAVVVKVLLPHYARDADVVSLFEHEAALGARLRHDHIVPVLEHGDSPAGPYIVSPYVHGASLAQIMREGPASLGAVLAVADDLLDALAFVHGATNERGDPLAIVHRDVSPDNLLVDRDGRCRLIDFGVAKSALRSSRTRTGVVRGKVAYLAPEQVNGSAVDARSDLYAAAVVLFELATGRPYLEADTDVALLRLAEEPPARAPSAFGADPRLDAPLKRALARFPEQRYHDATAMRRAFAALGTAGLAADGRSELAARVRSLRAEDPLPESATVLEPVVPPAGRYWRAPIAILATAAVASVLALSLRGAPTVPSAVAPSSGAALPSDQAEVPLPPVASPHSASASPSGSAEAEAPLPPLPSESPPGSASSPIVEAPRATATASARSRPSAVQSASAVPTADPVASITAPPVIDKAYVQRKIADVNRRIAAAKAEGKDVSSAEAKSASALEAYLDGRYEQSNRQLDGILATLR